MISQQPFPPAEQAAASAGILCQACPGDCLDACFNNAIVTAAGGIRVQAANCAGCGACIPACNLGHLQLKRGIARIVLP